MHLITISSPLLTVRVSLSVSNEKSDFYGYTNSAETVLSLSLRELSAEQALIKNKHTAMIINIADFKIFLLFFIKISTYMHLILFYL